MWSGDSRFLAFRVNPDVAKKIAVAGGPPLPLFSMKDLLFAGEWSRDGILLFSSRTDGAIYKVSSLRTDGSSPTGLEDRARGWT